eukprot:1554758-Rhodomonas_salina.2
MSLADAPNADVNSTLRIPVVAVTRTLFSSRLSCTDPPTQTGDEYVRAVNCGKAPNPKLSEFQLYQVKIDPCPEVRPTKGMFWIPLC